MSVEQYKKMALMRQCVGYKHAYYMFVWGNVKHRFLRCSWNWAAFFFGFLWFAYRKMYGYAVALFMLSVLCAIPQALNTCFLPCGDTMSRFIADIMALSAVQWFIQSSPDQIDSINSFLDTVGTYSLLLPLGLLLLCGIYGNYLYLRSVRRKVHSIECCYSENEQNLIINRRGGVSHLSLVIAFLLLQVFVVLAALIRKGIIRGCFF